MVRGATMEKWKVTARFPDVKETFSMEKPELIEKFSQYLPAISKPDFVSLSVSIGDMVLTIIPENRERKTWRKPRRK